jgi:hypothetical protein
MTKHKYREFKYMQKLKSWYGEEQKERKALRNMGRRVYFLMIPSQVHQGFPRSMWPFSQELLNKCL